MVDARGNGTTYDYDDAGNLETVTTPDGVTTYGYTDQDQISSVEDPRSHTEDRTYEPGGLLASVTTRAGDETSYSYNTAGRAAHHGHTARPRHGRDRV